MCYIILCNKQLSDNPLTTVEQLFDNCWTTCRQLSASCHFGIIITTVQQLSASCSTVVCKLFDSCQAVVQQLFESCSTVVIFVQPCMKCAIKHDACTEALNFTTGKQCNYMYNEISHWGMCFHYSSLFSSYGYWMCTLKPFSKLCMKELLKLLKTSIIF